MNRLESQGQKWFLLVCVLAIGPYLWQLARYLYELILISFTEYSLGYQFNLIQEVVLLILVGGIFLLMYRGYLWSKWIYVSLALIIFFGSAIFLMKARGNSGVIGPVQQKSLIIQMIINFCFILLPALLLVFSSPINAFLHYRHQLAQGELTNFESKLDEIGSHE
ncbi:MAG: hypothetical protein AAF927_06970 [Bacteroidota bacterium]